MICTDSCTAELSVCQAIMHSQTDWLSAFNYTPAMVYQVDGNHLVVVNLPAATVTRMWFPCHTYTRCLHVILQEPFPSQDLLTGSWGMSSHAAMWSMILWRLTVVYISHSVAVAAFDVYKFELSPSQYLDTSLVVTHFVTLPMFSLIFRVWSQVPWEM